MASAYDVSKLCRQGWTLVSHWRCVSFNSSQWRTLTSNAGDGRFVIGIPRETVNPWETRAPLAPRHVRELVDDGVDVVIQPSYRRAFALKEYIAVGARVTHDLNEAHAIIGVKRPRVEDLVPNKTYAFFSHTIKAQSANMALLDTILAKNIRLIDYECLVDENGKRMVHFGAWAGVAAAINALHGVGLRLLALGYHTPFLHCSFAWNYLSMKTAMEDITKVGKEFAAYGIPPAIAPLTMVVVGTGNVSKGVQELLRLLPHEIVTADELPKVVHEGSQGKVYICIVSSEEWVAKKDGSRFDRNEFHQHPERYRSIFAEKILPYCSVLINGIFWSTKIPRLLTVEDAKYLLSFESGVTASGPHQKLLFISDVSADVNGSVEFQGECTTMAEPFLMYDPETNSYHKRLECTKGILMSSIDNLPAQLPFEATEAFGDALLPFLKELAKGTSGDQQKSNTYGKAIEGAVIAADGKLTSKFSYITDLRKQNSALHYERRNPKVLILGAGYVAQPVIEYFSRSKETQLTVATIEGGRVESLVQSLPEVQVELVDVEKQMEKVKQLIEEHNLTISLLPSWLHPMIAKMCIEHKKHMVTGSYLSPEMKTLHEAAEAAGITVVNEVGLDPGIDHMLALEIINFAKDNGGKIDSFISWCGGLPAPECSNNPLRYKFSWSPRNVFTNVLGSAKYRQQGQTVKIAPNGEILRNLTQLDFNPALNIEGFPNRDSTKYIDIYDIPEAHTVLRGTLRYKGFVDVMKTFLDIGLLNDVKHQAFTPQIGREQTWPDLLKALLNVSENSNDTLLISKIKDKLSERADYSLEALEGLKLLSREQSVHLHGTPIDTLCDHLVKLLKFEPNESDMIILHHEIDVTWSESDKERFEVNLTAYGDPHGYSAMARTVGYPVAIAAKMVLDGEIENTGMVLPTERTIYRKILKQLRQEGIKASVKRKKLQI